MRRFHGMPSFIAALVVILAILTIPAGCNSKPDNEKCLELFTLNQDTVQDLIEDGCNVNMFNNIDLTPLMWAVENKRIAIVRLLLDNGADPNAKTKNGATALISAAKAGDLESVKLFLEHGADVNATTDDGMTALLYAADKERVELVKLLFENGADVSIENNKGDTAFQILRMRARSPRVKSRRESIKEILPMLAKAVGKESFLNEECREIFQASEKGENEKVRKLIDAGCDLDDIDDSRTGVTPLMYATRKKHVDIARLLLEHGADVNKGDRKGTTALMIAARSAKADLVELLLEHGAEVNQRGDGGGTALISAATSALSVDRDVVGMLLEHGADVNIRSMRTNALAAAAGKDKEGQVTKMMIEHGADDDSKNKAFLSASDHHDLAAMKLLIENGAYVFLKDADDNTALMLAARFRYNTPEALRILIDLGIDVNARNGSGNTALMELAGKIDSYHFIKKAELLLARGADAAVRNNADKTALQIAKEAIEGGRKPKKTEMQNFKDLTKLLERHSDTSTTGAEKELPVVVIARDGQYEQYSNGVVHDKGSGLEWYVGPDANTDWNSAESWAAGLSVAGGKWRLPTALELEGLSGKGKGGHNLTPLLETKGSQAWTGEVEDESSDSCKAKWFSLRYGASYPIRCADNDSKRAYAVRTR